MAEVAEQECGPLEFGCKAGNAVGDAISGAAGDAIEAIADAVQAALVATIAQLGTLWTTIDAGDLTTGQTGSADAPAGGSFNDQVATILGYATWIGLGISTIAIILLGITLVTNARRGDGAGLVNTATIVFGGAALVGGATSLVGYIVPRRAASSAPAVGFVQDQTFYLTLALAAISMIVAGVRMVWSQRAEPAQDLLKGLLTLAIVTASGIALLNVLLGATDALAEQIIQAGVGDDFQSDVQMLLGMEDTGTSSATFLMGNQMLIIVGGLLAVMVNIVQIMLMVLRTAMLFLIAGVLPLSAAFMNTETGKSWFSKIIAWTLAFAFYKPAAALIYATGIQMTTSGLFSGQALLQFSAGLMLILASVVALPVLIGFLSPALGAMASSGGGGGAAMGFAALGAAIPQGASRTPRGGQGFGSQAPPQGPPAKSGMSASTPAGGGAGSGDGAAPKGADVTGGGSKAVPTGSATSTTAGAGSTAGAGVGAGAGAGAAAAAPPVAAAMVAGQAIKKGGEAVQGAVQEGAQTGSGSGQGGSNSLPKAPPPSAAESGAKPSAQGAIPPQTAGGPAGAKAAGPKGASGASGPAGAALRQGAAQIQKQAQQLKNEVAKTTGNTGNEDRTDGANRR
ncbi:type IV secretion system protein [Arthrobacter sp. B0490]|uniref:type IV secretion system protein n=1 Tax=Arthrobacter sp. B0490 TaxID=2058891 RepID=UPI0011B07EF5|nr:type IV secretion system protein [Arthrobacter sp. B0490]